MAAGYDCQYSIIRIIIYSFLNKTANQGAIYLKVKEPIDIQSKLAATLHMITIRVILPQFTKIGCNRHKMGTRVIFLHDHEN